MLTACKQHAETVPTSSTAPAPKPVAPPTPAGVQVIKGYMAAWNSHDSWSAGNYFADDVLYVDTTMGPPQRGREAAVESVVKVFMNAVPDNKWEMRGEPVAAGDGIAFEWTLSGKNTGSWAFGVAATNQKLNLQGVSFVRVKDGKIVYIGNYYDGLTMNKQMGW